MVMLVSVCVSFKFQFVFHLSLSSHFSTVAHGIDRVTSLSIINQSE